MKFLQKTVRSRKKVDLGAFLMPLRVINLRTFIELLSQKLKY